MRWQGSKKAFVRSYLPVPHCYRASENFDISCEFFSPYNYANNFYNAGQVPIFRYFEAWIVLNEPPHQDFHCLLSKFIFGTRDLFNISYSRELYLFSKFLHFEEIVRVKMAVCFEMIVSET